MVEVRMLEQNSGTRPGGGEWPAPGEVIDVGEVEAEDLIRNRRAAPLAKKGARRNPDRVREREHDEAVADAETTQGEASTAHIHAARARFAADEAAEAADKAIADAEDAETDAEELQARADKAKDAKGRTEPRSEHGPGQAPSGTSQGQRHRGAEKEAGNRNDPGRRSQGGPERP